MQRVVVTVSSLALLLVIQGIGSANPDPARILKKEPAPAGDATRAERRTAAKPKASRKKRSRRRGKAKTAEDLLGERIKGIWAGRDLRRGVTAVYVVDAKTGELLYAVHEDDPMNPASNVKLIATATALEVLGPEFRYRTRVLGPAATDEGVVGGDLYLLGTYDPLLHADDIEELAEDLVAAGVTRVKGDIVVGEEANREAVSRPRVRVRVTAAAKAGEPPTVEITPATEFVQVENLARTVRSRKRRKKRRKHVRLKLATKVIDDAGKTRVRLKLSGTIPVGYSSGYRRRVPRAVLFTGHLLRAALIAEGVEVEGSVEQRPLSEFVARTDRVGELARYESAPLSNLVKNINKRSINFLADWVVATAGAARYGGPPSLKKGVRAMEEWLRERAHIDPDKLVIDTGSGLSYKTELTARQIVRVLRTAAGYATPAADTVGDEQSADDLERIFVNSLAVGGVDGTLRSRFRNSPARGQVLAKTGTLTRVIALAGIVQTDVDDGLAFAIISNGHLHKRRGTIRDRHEDMVEAMYAYLEARKGENP